MAVSFGCTPSEFQPRCLRPSCSTELVAGSVDCLVAVVLPCLTTGWECRLRGCYCVAEGSSPVVPLSQVTSRGKHRKLPTRQALPPAMPREGPHKQPAALALSTQEGASPVVLPSQVASRGRHQKLPTRQHLPRQCQERARPGSRRRPRHSRPTRVQARLYYRAGSAQGGSTGSCQPASPCHRQWYGRRRGLWHHVCCLLCHWCHGWQQRLG